MSNIKIAVIGLGYVGLPLAVATKHPVIGFDINEVRVAELKSGHDATLEIDSVSLSEVGGKIKFRGWVCFARLIRSN
jgi:UDP-N-acetyl-D-galactosamine dehydrogenase